MPHFKGISCRSVFFLCIDKRPKETVKYRSDGGGAWHRNALFANNFVTFASPVLNLLYTYGPSQTIWIC